MKTNSSSSRIPQNCKKKLSLHTFAVSPKPDIKTKRTESRVVASRRPGLVLLRRRISPGSFPPGDTRAPADPPKYSPGIARGSGVTFPRHLHNAAAALGPPERKCLSWGELARIFGGAPPPISDGRTSPLLFYLFTRCFDSSVLPPPTEPCCLSPLCF